MGYVRQVRRKLKLYVVSTTSRGGQIPYQQQARIILIIVNKGANPEMALMFSNLQQK